MNILYEDNALVVLDKPAGLSSEEGVPAALRQHWDTPDAFVGVVHRLDTGVSGLMVCARTPKAAAALTRQITQSQEAYAVLDGRAAPAQNTLPAPVFTKQYRAVLAGAPDETLPEHGILRDYLFKDSRKGRVFPVSRPRKGVREAVLEYRITASNGTLSLADINPPHRADPSDPGAVRLPAASALGRRQIRQPFQGNHCTAERTALFSAPGDRGADGVRIGKAGHGTMERLASAFGRSVHSIFSPSA